MTSSPDAQLATMMENLTANTGKSLDEWIALSRKGGPAKHGALVSWLKESHGLAHGYANLVAHMTFKSDAGIKLKSVPAAGRLEPAGSWNAMVTHRVRLESAEQVDAELLQWIRRAYEQA